MAAFNRSDEHEPMNPYSVTLGVAEREEGPGKPEGTERPEIAIPTGPDGSGQEQDVAEIQPVPVTPELAPAPERLKN
jgi:hypothetical protein